jgi:hypothetical protein
MLAPLVIDLLCICIFMLVSGWLHDILQATSPIGRPDAHLATAAPAASIAKAAQKWAGRERTTFHA